jgi:hypothetical protein
MFGLDSSGLGQGLVAGSCEYGNKSSKFICVATKHMSVTNNASVTRVKQKM